ncbi:MAG: DUF819 family protein [Bacteroidia bacterium]|nr:DUF819 family protein [Bacteroidia bacterium]
MEPVFTSDAILLGILMLILGFVFFTSESEKPIFKNFYRYVPALLVCYFLPALLHWPLGLIASHWYEWGLIDHLSQLGYTLPNEGMSFAEIEQWIKENNIPDTQQFEGHSQLYYVASRYLLPASLVLLCISIDFKGLINLGPKALIMFLAGTLGIVIGGPIALYIVLNFFPEIIAADADQLWRGLSTVAGSWIGGGANQNAMAVIYEVVEKPIFPTMIIVDVVVANIWMGFLLYGANVSEKVDNWLKADSSAIEELKSKMANYKASVAEIPSTTALFVLMAVAFGAVGLSHWGKDVITPIMNTAKDTLESWGLHSLLSSFFWLIVISTAVGVGLSFTKARKLEGVGASSWGTIFIFILVVTIGMKMNLGEVFKNLGLFAIGIIWMIFHVVILLIVAKLIKAPFFFVAVGSQANVGGAASAPVVASAFSPSLAPVGALMAVLGYGVGTLGAILCAELMRSIAGG